MNTRQIAVIPLYPGFPETNDPEYRNNNAAKQTKLKIFGVPLVISNKRCNFAKVFRAQR